MSFKSHSNLREMFASCFSLNSESQLNQHQSEAEQGASAKEVLKFCKDNLPSHGKTPRAYLIKKLSSASMRENSEEEERTPPTTKSQNNEGNDATYAHACFVDWRQQYASLVNGKTNRHNILGTKGQTFKDGSASDLQVNLQSFRADNVEREKPRVEVIFPSSSERAIDRFDQLSDGRQNALDQFCQQEMLGGHKKKSICGDKEMNHINHDSKDMIVPFPHEKIRLNAKVPHDKTEKQSEHYQSKSMTMNKALHNGAEVIFKNFSDDIRRHNIPVQAKDMKGKNHSRSFRMKVVKRMINSPAA